ncbi:MAG: helix-turn-helix domain-containing protein [Patescibacteria group bacterium]
MDIDKIKAILINVGLSKLETDCFLALLKRSPQRASEISRALDVPKATVLVALNRLSDRFSIVKRTKQKNSYQFVVEDPRDLLHFLEREETVLAQHKKAITMLLPEMRSLQEYEVAKPKMYYYEGKEGVKQVFMQVLNEADDIIGYGSNEDDVKYLPELYPAYYEQRVKRKIPVTAIIPASPFNIAETIKNEMAQLRKTHLIPAQYNYPIQVNIYKNTTVFYSFEESFALVIKSKPISECLRAIFEFAFASTAEADKTIRSAHHAE